eukprot:scaffold7379_cov366-Prasinococcus_capsulatus_cf.AAC.3
MPADAAPMRCWRVYVTTVACARRSAATGPAARGGRRVGRGHNREALASGARQRHGRSVVCCVGARGAQLPHHLVRGGERGAP